MTIYHINGKKQWTFAKKWHIMGAGRHSGGMFYGIAPFPSDLLLAEPSDIYDFEV